MEHADSEQPRSPWRKRQVVLCAVAVIVVAYLIGASVMVLYDIRRPGYDPKSDRAKAGAILDTKHDEHRRAGRDSAFAGLTISVRSIDARSYRVDAVVTVRFYDATLVNNAGQPIGSNGEAYIGATIGTAKVEANVRIVLITAHGSSTVEIPAQEFDLRTATATSTISLPVTGFPQDFPGDHYDLDAVGWVYLPAGVAVRSNSTKTTSVAAHTVFTVGSGLSYWRIHGGQPEDVAEDPRLIGAVGSELYRPYRFQQWIWVLCTVPPVFMLVYFLLSLAGVVRTGTSHFELGVALLAIITMRQIFVPEGVQTITTLDHLLGVSLLACVVMASVVVLFEVGVFPRSSAWIRGKMLRSRRGARVTTRSDWSPGRKTRLRSRRPNTLKDLQEMEMGVDDENST